MSAIATRVAVTGDQSLDPIDLIQLSLIDTWAASASSMVRGRSSFVAAAVNPELPYSRVEYEGKIYYLSSGVVENIFKGDMQRWLARTCDEVPTTRVPRICGVSVDRRGTLW